MILPLFIDAYNLKEVLWYQDTSLIDLAKQWFFTIFLILKSW
jgi:hypothetical protein